MANGEAKIFINEGKEYLVSPDQESKFILDFPDALEKTKEQEEQTEVVLNQVEKIADGESDPLVYTNPDTEKVESKKIDIVVNDPNTGEPTKIGETNTSSRPEDEDSVIEPKEKVVKKEEAKKPSFTIHHSYGPKQEDVDSDVDETPLILNEDLVPIVNLKTGKVSEGLQIQYDEFGEVIGTSKEISYNIEYNDGTVFLRFADGTEELISKEDWERQTKDGAAKLFRSPFQKEGEEPTFGMLLGEVRIEELNTVENIRTLRETREAGVDANTILNLGKGNDGWILGDGEGSSIDNAAKYLAQFDITLEKGTTGDDGYLKVRMPDGTYLDHKVEVKGIVERTTGANTKQRGIKEWDKLVKVLARPENLKKLTLPYNKKEINKFFNGIDPTLLETYANYDENEFENLIDKLLGSSKILRNQTGIGDAYEGAVLKVMPNGKIKTVNVHTNLQPNQQSNLSDVEKLLFGGGVNEVAEYGVKPYFQMAEWTALNPRRAAIYNEFSPNDSTQEVITSGETFRFIKGLDVLSQMYKEVADMEITSPQAGVYVVTKSGKEVFRGTSKYFSGGKSYVDKNGEIVNYSNNLQDFMTNYNWTDEELNGLALQRINIAKELEKTEGKTKSDVAHIYDSNAAGPTSKDVTNIVAAHVVENTASLKIKKDENELAEEEILKQSEKESKEFELIGKDLMENRGRALIEKYGGSISFNEELGAFEITINSDDPKAKKEATQFSKDINDWHHTLKTRQDLYQDGLNEIFLNKNTIANASQQNKERGEAVSYNFSMSDQFAFQWQTGWKKIAMTLPGLISPKSVVKASDAIELKQSKFGPALTWERAIDEGRILEFTGDVFTEQGANLVSIIATAGTAGALGIGAKTTQTIIGTYVGLQSAGETNIQYESLQNKLDESKLALKEYEKLFKNNEISSKVYNKKRVEIENFIDDNKFSNVQRFLDVGLTGVIEGTFTKYIAASNFTNFTKAFNPFKNNLSNFNLSNTRAVFDGFKGFGKGLTLENIEEGGIYTFTQLSNSLIYGKRADFSNIDDVIAKTSIMSGGLVGPTSFQNTIKTSFVNNKIKNSLKEIKLNLSNIDKSRIKLNTTLDVNSPTFKLQNDFFREQRQNELNKIGLLNSELELSALSLNVKDLNSIVGLDQNLNFLKTSAGVDITFTNEKQNEVINNHVKKLEETDVDAANEFKEQYDNALNAKNEILNKVGDLKQTVNNLYGPAEANKVFENLVEKNPKLKEANSNDQAIAIHNEFKNITNNRYIANAKLNKGVVNYVNSRIYGPAGKPKGRPSAENIAAENDLFMIIGSKISADIDNAVIINKQEGILADKILQNENLADLEVTEAKDDGAMQEAVIQAYDAQAKIEVDKMKKRADLNKQEKIDAEQSIVAQFDAEADNNIKALRSNDLNGIIVGGKYIVKDKKAADAAVKDGFLLAGTALSHEISHAIDYLAFDKEGVTNYGKKLHNYMQKNYPELHDQAKYVQASIGNYNPVDNTFPNNEDTYYDEYSKSIQDILMGQNSYRGDKESILKLSPKVSNNFKNMISGARTAAAQETGVVGKTKAAIAGVKETLQGRGDFTINSGRDAAVYLSSFIRGFENGEVGKLQEKRIDYRKRQGTTRGVEIQTKKSSNVQNILNEYGGRDASKTDIRNMVNQTLTKTPQGQETFDITKSRFGQEINPITEAITKRLYDKIPTDATRAAGLTRADYKNALVSEAATITQQEYDPTKQDLDKFISNRLNLRAESLAKRLGVEEKILKDVDFIKETDIETVAETIVETDISEARVLGDFDIALEDGMVDAQIVAEVESLIELNPKDLPARMEKLILTDIRKNLDNSIGKIAKDKETGVVKPTAEYETFIRDEFKETIDSLGIETIRTAYKPFFKQEKIGTKDYKNIDPITGKVSNYRKDVFINTASKPDYIKYFTQGKPNVLRERRTGLIRRISRRKAEIAVDNYIERNSLNMDAVTEAKLRSLSRTAKNIKNEQVSFDSVKYSKQVELRVEQYMKMKKPNGKPMFGTKGHALEQVIIDMLGEYGLPISNLELRVKEATEQGGLADINLTAFGKPLNIEVKMNKFPPMGSVLVSSYDVLYDSNFSVAKSSMRLPFNSIKDLAKNEIKEYRAAYNNKVEAYNNKHAGKKGFKPEPLMPANVVGHKMVHSIYKELQVEGYQKRIKRAGTFTSQDAQPLIDHYQGKPAGAVDAIEIFGEGLYSFVPNSVLGKNVPFIKDMARVKTDLIVKSTGRKGKYVNGKKVLTKNSVGDTYLDFRLQFQNTLVGLKPPPNPISLTRKQDMAMVFGAPVKKNLAKNYVKASKNARTTRKYHANPRGMSTFDFDETLIDKGKNFILAKDPATGETTKISSADWPLQGPRFADQGYTFDFSDFVNVRGGVEGPLLQKMRNQIAKFGPENVFVLTARPQASADAIHGWLKSKKINIPFENITGLANSTGAAKAEWMLQKFAEGYNDMYFVDDALPNVEAVKNALDQLDIKSNVQQVRAKFSQNIDADFNQVLQEVTGIDAAKRFSDIKARKRGAGKGKFRFFIPPSHEDFAGLLYNFMGKGRQGDKHKTFFEKTLIKPLNRGYRELDTAKQAIANDYKQLNKQFDDVKGMLKKKTPDGDFTYEDAIRVYLWNKHAYDIPGLSNTDRTNLSDIVLSNTELQAYAETLNTISKQDKYVDPGLGWEGGNIRTDLIDATGRVGRAEYFNEFNENSEIMFSKENLNKIEAAYGKSVKDALEDILHRIKTGVNRPKGQSATTNKFMNYLNGSVGSVMFFNTRSAILQQMSIVNYLNFADNNILAAAKAFANQKQYWADFAFIFNSDMLKQRRGGIGTDINGAELAQAVAKAGDKGIANQSKIVIGKLLQLGFLPTQIGDNIAIATGGATFYRNRINKYIKDGLSKAEAETKAFDDFQDVTQSTQQSSRPDMVSKQQASWIGKLVLNFQNITSQYNRIIKKSASDIFNRRITQPNTTQLQSDLSNLSRILYYGAVQNAVFYGLQTALFAVMFDDDQDEDKILGKKERILQGTFDSLLRGTGIYGATVSTLKNMYIKYQEQRDKGYNKDESAVLMEMLNFSPVVGIKARKIVNAEKTLNYNKNIIKEMDTFDIDNPLWSASTNYVEAITNFPANRLLQKSINVRNSLDNQYTTFERAMFFAGYTTWSLGIGDTKEMIEIKENIKEKKKIKTKEDKKLKKEQKIREENPGLNEEEIQVKIKSEEMFSLKKGEQQKLLKDLGLSDEEILGLKKEQDRADRIAELYKDNSELIDKFMLNPDSIEIKAPKKPKTQKKKTSKKKTFTRKSF